MGKRVMIVDDSLLTEIQMRELLEDTNYEVAAYCRTGPEALEIYDSVKPDLVTMDILMPGMDGLETAQAIMEDHPEAKIIMVSSLAYAGSFDEAKKIGAKTFLCKPFGYDELLEALDKAVMVDE